MEYIFSIGKNRRPPSKRQGSPPAREKLRFLDADRLNRESSVSNLTCDVDAKVVGFGRFAQELNSFGIALRIKLQKIPVRRDDSEPGFLALKFTRASVSIGIRLHFARAIRVHQRYIVEPLGPGCRGNRQRPQLH